VTEQVEFAIDQNRCLGCKACQTACKDKNELDVGQLWRRVTEVAGGGYYEQGQALRNSVYAFWTSIACNHCEHPKCVENCPTGAMQKRPEDGVVFVDKAKCIGCRMCTWSCPYGAPQYNPKEGKVGKCNYCIDEVGKGPVCVAACPVRAIHSGKLEDLKKKYGATNQTIGMPDSSITTPSLVITPHKDAIR